MPFQVATAKVEQVLTRPMLQGIEAVLQTAYQEGVKAVAVTSMYGTISSGLLLPKGYRYSEKDWAMKVSPERLSLE